MAIKKAIEKTKPARKRKAKSKDMMSSADIDKLYQAQADTEAARLPTTGSNKLSIRGGAFTYKGADLGEAMDVIILGFAFENAWYRGQFDPENPQPPACAAVSLDKDTMVPFADVPDQQSITCDTCELNVFGSADVGRGKACKNIMRLVLMASSDLKTTPEEVEVVRLDIPPSSLGNFNKYIKGINKLHHRPAHGVITNVAFDETADFEKLIFDCSSKISSGADINVIEAQRANSAELLLQGYDFSSYAPPVEKKKRTTRRKKDYKTRD